MVDILLSTFNSEKFIKDQINSIISQSFKEWKLIIRDDGSTDNTVKIIESLNDKRIVFIKDELGNIGTLKSFSILLNLSYSTYTMFCDHDDIWFSNKISIFINTIEKLEKKFKKKKPILVHGNMTLMDEFNNSLNVNFWDYGYVNPKGDKLNHLLIQNTITGCSTIFNDSLKKIAQPIPNNIYMHDWWIGIIASSIGLIHRVDEPTMYYRIHSNNQIGVKKYSINMLFYKLMNFKKNQFILLKTFIQAREILNLFQKNNLTVKTKNRILLEEYSTMISKNLFNKIKSLYKFKFLRFGFLRQLYTILLLFFIVDEN